MKTRTLKELLLYNYRYWVGYSIVIGFIIYFLGWRLGSLTPGLSAPELSVAAQHTSLLDIFKNPVYPLHALLQWGSFEVFGASPFVIRLATVALSLGVAFFLYQLLRKWLGKPTALLGTALYVSADWFLFIARNATGGIEFSFWLALSLFSLMKLLEKKKIWLLPYSVALVGLLFCPLGVYAAVTLITGTLVCRVFRERITETALIAKVLSGIVFLAGIGGAILLSINNLAFLKNILGIQNLPSILEYFRNVFINTSAVVAVFPNANPSISPNGILFIRFFELIFIAFGVIMFWRTRVNRLNLLVLALSTVLVLFSGLSSGSRGGGLILVPAAIFMTAGIRHFRYRWQRTFPMNPYARIAAVIPLTFLFVSAAALHYVSYFKLWPSQPAATAVFSKDYDLARVELKKSAYENKSCLVDTGQNENMLKLLRASKLNCNLQQSATTNTAPDISLIRPESRAFMNPETTPQALISDATQNNVRWLVVTRATE